MRLTEILHDLALKLIKIQPNKGNIRTLTDSSFNL
jgi:hypothetical protein